MRAFQEGPDVFVVEEDPWVFRAILFFVIGVLTWGLHDNWAETSWFVRVFMGGFIGLLGVIFFKVLLNVTARFDRSAGRVEISRRGLLGAREETYSLRHFLRARIEESKDSDGSTFRLVLVFSEAMPALLDPALRERLEKQRRRGLRGLPLNEIPLTDYLSSGRRAPTNAADAINAWARVAPA
jgi:hypothetical protein